MIDLQRFRKIKKIHQSDISEMTGLNQAVVSRYESKKHVTPFITAVLLEKIPELESYMIEDDSHVNEESPVYSVQDYDRNNLLETLKNLSESNKVLAESIAQAIEIQQSLINKLHESD